MKTVTSILLIMVVICGLAQADDFIRLGTDKIPAGTMGYDLVFHILRECPTPTDILGAYNGFEIISTGTATWTWVDQYQDAASSIDWNLGGMQWNLLDIDGNFPDYFATGGFAMTGAGMPIISIEEPYFHLILDVASIPGEICIDSCYVGGAGAWEWAGLTCGEGGSAERPLFLAYDYSDVYHPICIDIHDPDCIPPNINVYPPVNIIYESWCTPATFTFGADPGLDEGNPAYPLLWYVIGGSGSIDVNTGDFQYAASPPGSYFSAIRVINSCFEEDEYFFDVIFTNGAPSFTNCPAYETVPAGELFSYDFASSDVDPCDVAEFSFASVAPTPVNAPAISMSSGGFEWLSDVSEFGNTFTFTVRVTDLKGAYSECSFPVEVTAPLEPPDFWLKDCPADDGSTIPSPCPVYWDYGVEHNISNMCGAHGRILLRDAWNKIQTVVRNRGGAGDGFLPDNTARLFAYWHESASGLTWPPPDPELDMRRIYNDPVGAITGTPSIDPDDFVDVLIFPYSPATPVTWDWFCPATLATGYDHACIGFVINPEGPGSEPEGETPPSGDMDRPGGERRPRWHNNIAQINVEYRGVCPSGPKGSPETLYYPIEVWNHSEQPTFIRTTLDIYGDTNQDFSAYVDPDVDSMYIPDDTCEVVYLMIDTDSQAQHGASCTIVFVAEDIFTEQVVGGVSFEIHVDVEEPDSSSFNLEALCWDPGDPNCCGPWVPPEICGMMGDRMPLQWDVPHEDESGADENVWFFIVCRGLTAEVSLEDQIDSVAMDQDIATEKFEWMDNTYERQDSSIYYCIYAVDEAGNISGRSNVVEITGVPCGDVDGSGAVDIDDIVCLIGYIFPPGNCEVNLYAADVNCDGSVDIDDVVWLIGYIFIGGNAPCDLDGDGDADC